MAQRENPRPSKGGVQAGDLAGVGFQLAASVLLFLFVGQWLDRKVGTDGLFTIAGVFVGFGASMYSLIRKLKPPRDGDR